MKELDLVRLLKDKKEFNEQGVKKGDEGIILDGPREGYFLVSFHDEVYKDKDGKWQSNSVELAVLEQDLEIIPYYTITYINYENIDNSFD